MTNGAAFSFEIIQKQYAKNQGLQLSYHLYSLIPPATGMKTNMYGGSSTIETLPTMTSTR